MFSAAALSRSDDMVMKPTRGWSSNWHSRLALIHIRGATAAPATIGGIFFNFAGKLHTTAVAVAARTSFIAGILNYF